MAIKWNDLSVVEQQALMGLFPITLEFVFEEYKDLEKSGLVDIVRIDHRYCQVNITAAGRDVQMQIRAAVWDAAWAAARKDNEDVL